MIFRFDDDNGMYYEFEFPNVNHIYIVVYNPPLVYHSLLKDYDSDKIINWGRNDGSYYVSDNAKKYITKVLKNLAFT
jgi:hypothetical protein